MLKKIIPLLLLIVLPISAVSQSESVLPDSGNTKGMVSSTRLHLSTTLDDSIEALQRFLRFEPYNSEVYQQLGDMLYVKKLLPLVAVGEWQRSVVLDPYNGVKHFYLAWVYLKRLYDLDRAELSALKAIMLGRKQDKMVTFWYQLSYWVLYQIYEQRNMPEQAAYYKKEWFAFWKHPAYSEPPVTVVREQIRLLKKALAFENP